MLRFLSRLFTKISGARRDERLYAEIDALTLKLHIDQQQDLCVIDVRNPHEFSGEIGHIKGARNLPIGELPSHLANLSELRDQAIVVVCLTDKRSLQAINLMHAEGYTKLTLLRGGMKGWSDAQLAVER